MSEEASVQTNPHCRTERGRELHTNHSSASGGGRRGGKEEEKEESRGGIRGMEKRGRDAVPVEVSVRSAPPPPTSALFLPLYLLSPPTLLSPIFSSSPIVFTSAVSCPSPPTLLLLNSRFLQRDSPSQAFPPSRGGGRWGRRRGGR